MSQGAGTVNFMNIKKWTVMVTPLVVVALTSAGFATPATAAGGNASRENMISSFRTVYEPLTHVDIVFTGNVKQCQSNKAGSDTEKAALKIVNYYRSLAGVKPLTLNPKKSADALAGALAMDANGGSLSALTKGMKCYTPAGARSLSSSLQQFIRKNTTGSNPVELPLSGLVAGVDPLLGGTKSAEAERRWLLSQRAKTMGYGFTDKAIMVNIATSPSVKVKKPRWAAWPGAGYFPAELEPNGMWSLSYPGADFSKAKVKVSSSRGPVTLSIANKTDTRQGDNSIVWYMDLKKYGFGSAGFPPAEDSTFTVVVSGIRVNGKTVTHAYQVIMASAQTPYQAPPPPPTYDDPEDQSGYDEFS
jgi:hypothetical protein